MGRHLQNFGAKVMIRHNMAVLAAKSEQLLLPRIPTGPVKAEKFGCLAHHALNGCEKKAESASKHLFQTALQTTKILVHHSTMISTSHSRLWKPVLMATSDILAGRQSAAFKKILEEVFAIVVRDEGRITTHNDPLIVQLEEAWLRRSIDTKFKRKLILCFSLGEDNEAIAHSTTQRNESEGKVQLSS